MPELYFAICGRMTYDENPQIGGVAPLKFWVSLTKAICAQWQLAHTHLNLSTHVAHSHVQRSVGQTLPLVGHIVCPQCPVEQFFGNRIWVQRLALSVA